MTQHDLATMRENYTLAGLDESDLADTWLAQFERWLGQAIDGGVTEPNAMVLSTATRDGLPSGRTVLAKAVDAAGVVFYTNYTSAKSHDLEDNPFAAATFPWYQLQRQVHIRGRVHRVDEATSLAYWQQRPRASQIGAWSSPQSTVVAGRSELDRLQQYIEGQFGTAAVTGVTGHPAGVAGHPVAVAGQPVAVAGRPAGVAGRPVAVAGRPAGVAGRPAGVAGRPVAVAGHPVAVVDVAGHPAGGIPLPPHWGGWRIEPVTVEFWQGRSGRMHDRLRYRLISDHAVDDRWVVERLAP